MPPQMGTSTEKYHRDYAAKPEVKKYLSHPSTNPPLYEGSEIRLFDIIFANATFTPSPDQILMEYKLDKNLNPNNDSYYPYLRTGLDIIADYRTQTALCLLVKRNEAMGHQLSVDMRKWVNYG